MKTWTNLLLALLAAVTGCSVTPTVVSQVESYSALPKDYAAQRIAVRPFDEAIADSLEFQSLKAQLEARLRGVGFSVVALDEPHQYIAFFGYGIDQGREVLQTYSVPQYGITGYSSARATTTVSKEGDRRTYTSTTTYTPEYGFTGYTSEVTSATIYTRSLAVAIADAAGKREIWSMRAVSQGPCGIIKPVIEPMLDAAFSGFPETNGRVAIEVPDLDC
ncbi:MAG: DUF4136 domain-containing protein [Rhodospirillales bacterium]|nr:MAG: DUF4136 domain-containing protein [Rhodospirillales bacterium]